MRFLVAHPGPSFSVSDVHAGWCEALRAAGQTVLEFPLDSVLTFYTSALLETLEKGKFKRAFDNEQAMNLSVDRLYTSGMKFRPHVLLVISGFFIPPELLEIFRQAGVTTVLVHTESPYEDERQQAIASWADYNLVNDPTNLDAFRAHGHAEYVPHAFRPSVHHPGMGSPAYACDLAFCGTGFPSRVSFFSAMDLTGIRLALGGNWRLLPSESPLLDCLVNDVEECLDNDQTAELYRSAKVGINFYRREAKENDTADGWACGPREIEMAACRLPFLRDPRPESDELFPMLPTFTDAAEASELTRWWLAHPGLRETAAFKAREAVAGRTFDAHAARLLRLLDKE